MAKPTKPAAQPLWATTGTSVEPTLSKKMVGWLIEKPLYEFFNWWQNLVYQWTNYAELMTDYTDAQIEAGFDAIVGAAAHCTDATIQDAIDRVSAGARILVIDSFALAVTVDVNKAGLKIIFKGLAALTDGGAAVALDISAADCMIEGGQISGFSSYGISIAAGGLRSKLRDIYFNANADDVLDPNTLSSAIGCTN